MASVIPFHLLDLFAFDLLVLPNGNVNYVASLMYGLVISCSKAHVAYCCLKLNLLCAKPLPLKLPSDLIRA
jgi:hypothetical protein